DEVDQSVTDAVSKAKERLESLGATVDEVDMPNLKYVVSSYYLIASSEASANLARFDGIRFGYRSENANNLDELYKKSRGEGFGDRSEEHTSELQSRFDLVCRLLLEKKNI